MFQMTWKFFLLAFVLFNLKTTATIKQNGIVHSTFKIKKAVHFSVGLLAYSFDDAKHCVITSSSSRYKCSIKVRGGSRDGDMERDLDCDSRFIHALLPQVCAGY